MTPAEGGVDRPSAMSTEPPDLRSMSIPELMRTISDAMGAQYMARARPLTDLATTMLQFRISERQTEAMAQQAKASEDLAKFTRTLVWATWALVFFGGATLLLTLVQTLKALGIMR